MEPAATSCSQLNDVCPLIDNLWWHWYNFKQLGLRAVVGSSFLLSFHRMGLFTARFRCSARSAQRSTIACESFCRSYRRGALEKQRLALFGALSGVGRILREILHPAQQRHFDMAFVVVVLVAVFVSVAAQECGSGAGNAVCPSGQCCSKYFWCGTSSAYCGTGTSLPLLPMAWVVTVGICRLVPARL